MRLHQPYRPLQPTQPCACSSVIPSHAYIRANTYVSFLVCPTRIWSACLPRFVFPALGSMVGVYAEYTASSIQRPKVRQSPSPSTPLYSLYSACSLRPILLTLFPFTELCPKAISTTQRKSSERFHNTKRRASSSSAFTSSPSSTIYTGTFVLCSSPTTTATLTTYSSPFLLLCV